MSIKEKISEFFSVTFKWYLMEKIGKIKLNPMKNRC